MNEDGPEHETERLLWQQYLSALEHRPGPSAQVDVNLLASYLDGTANESETAIVESRAASDPQFLDRLVALRDVHNAPKTASEGLTVPASVYQRAVSLSAATLNRAMPGARLGLAWSWRDAVRWAVAAVVFTAVGGAGYFAGQDVSRYEMMSESFAVTAADRFNDLEEEDSLLFVAVLGGGVR